MSSRKKSLVQSIIIPALAVVVVIAFGPFPISIRLAPVGLALRAVYFLAYVFAVVMLPLMLFALLRFAYSLFARPYLRAWHINRIRNARYLKEVVDRGRRGE